MKSFLFVWKKTVKKGELTFYSKPIEMTLENYLEKQPNRK